MIHLFQVHRRRPPTGLVVCLTIAALFSGKALAQNLISNGDFETGPFDINNTVSSWTDRNAERPNRLERRGLLSK